MNIHLTTKRPITWTAVSATLVVVGILLFFGPFSEARAQGGPPERPNKPTGSALWVGMVTIEWNEVSGADSYDVQYFDGSQWADLPANGIEIVFYGAGAVVRGLSSSASFTFRVRAVNSQGASAWSDFNWVRQTDGPRAWEDVPEPTNIVATGAPTISGTMRVPKALTAGTSGISDDNGLDRVRFQYQWIRSDATTDTDIAGATESVYRLTAADAGKSVKVRVSFTDRHGFSESLTSEATAAVAAQLNNAATGTPVIEGLAQVGETLTANTSDITDADGLERVSFRYQWVRNDSSTANDIENATSKTHTLEYADEGKTIGVRVFFTDDDGNHESLTSTSTATVLRPITSPPQAVEVSVGASGELYVSWTSPSGVIAPTGYRVQWKHGDLEYDETATSTRQAVLDSGDVQSHTITDLTDGTEYTIRVVAQFGPLDSSTSFEVTATPEAPNVILILVDDLGYRDVSFNGSKDIHTANLDNLAESGALFTSAYVNAPICTPSRAGLLTGRYATRFGIEENIFHNPYDLSQGLPLEETLFPAYLRDAGYRTGIVGKWQLGSASPFNPLNRGFDYFYGFLAGGHNYWKVDMSQPERYGMLPLMENKAPMKFDGYLTDALTDKAIEFITEEDDDPFFLYLAYNAPHGPFEAPEELVSKYSDSTWRSKNARKYLAMIDSLDQNVGRLIDTLQSSGKRDNTIVFFLSDNGGLVNHTIGKNTRISDNGDLRAEKGSFYEGGIRVPFAASWPARWPANQRYKPMVISLDIAATVIAAAGATVTDEDRPIEGVNLDPYLRGEANTVPHEALFWRSSLGTTTAVVRAGNMKLIQVRGGTPQLYDLASDVGEERDVMESNSETAAEMAELWNEWNRDNYEGTLVHGLFNYQGELKRWTQSQAAERREQAESQPVHRIVISAQGNTPATGAPIISGTLRVDETLTADTSGITDADDLSNATYSYQWLADDADIAGATSSRHTLTESDQGKAISVRVSFTDDAGNEETLTSVATAAVEVRANNPATGAPIISGTPRVGDSLTADTSGITDADGLSNATFSYQWLADDADITGATGSSHTLTGSAEGKSIKLRVSFTDDAGNAETLTSEATAAVDAAVVWESELTVGQVPDVLPEPLGYSGPGNYGATLSPDHFEIDGTVHTVQYMFRFAEGVWLGVDSELPSEFTLSIGGSSYEGSDSRVPPTGSADGGYWWPLTTPGWSAGESVQVSLSVQSQEQLGSREKAPLIGYFFESPTEHDGQSAFTFELQFYDEPHSDFSYRTLRDDAFTVTGGSVDNARRLKRPSNLRWEITVSPDGNGEVVITLPATTDCEAGGAICTGDDRMLFNRIDLTVAGPSG